MMPLTNAQFQVEKWQAFDEEHDDVRNQESTCKMEFNEICIKQK